MANLKNTTIDGALIRPTGTAPTISSFSTGNSGSITAQENISYNFLSYTNTVVFSSADHSLTIDTPIQLTAGNQALPAGLTPGTTYYVQRGVATAYIGTSGVDNNFSVSTVPGGPHVSYTGGYEGTFTTNASYVTNSNRITLDVSTGDFFELDLESITVDNIKSLITSNIPSAGSETSFDLKITQGSTARDFDWSSLTNVKWSNGKAPSLDALNDSTHILSFMNFGTSTWYGRLVGINFD